MISKDPERNLLCLIVLVLSLFLPGLLQLCINEREMFLLLDPIRVLLYALTFSVPMYAVCFSAELIYTAKYLGQAELRECSLSAGIGSILSLCILILMVHWIYSIPVDLLALYLLFMFLEVIACRRSKKAASRKKAHIQNEVIDTNRKESESAHQD